MHLRRDAVAAAAEWIVEVEHEAKKIPGLVATVGSVRAIPGVTNVIAKEAALALDVRHAADEVRRTTVNKLISAAEKIAVRRGMSVSHSSLESPSVLMDSALVDKIEQAVKKSGCEAHRMVSGAGHDAMILAEKVPAAMIFLRSPGGISHSPEETVNTEDVEKALDAGIHLLHILESQEFLRSTPHA